MSSITLESFKNNNWLKLRIVLASVLFVIFQLAVWQLVEASHQEMVSRYVTMDSNSEWESETWFIWIALATIGGLIVSGVLVFAVTFTYTPASAIIFLGFQFLLWYLAGLSNAITSWDEQFLLYLGYNVIFCMFFPMIVGVLMKLIRLF